MTTTLIKPSVTIDLDGDTFTIKRGSNSSLDHGRVPYAAATVILPLLDDTLLELLDPRTDVRPPIAASCSGVDRDFDLGLRSRTVDHKAKTVTLELAGDEALLQDYATLTLDTGARANEASARDICDYVLGKIGASLEAGADDADMTAHWSVTNLLPNPRAANDIASWTSGDNVIGSPLRITSGPPAPPVGTTCVGWNPNTAAESNMIPASGTNMYRVTPGKWYVFTFYGLCTTGRTSRAAIQWWTSGGQSLSSTSFGTSAATGTNTWQRRHVIAQAPEGADQAYPYMNTSGNAGSMAEAHYITMAMFYEGDELVPYFDGATTDTSTYTYDWSKNAHASTSARTPVVERLPELFVWKAGVTAWEFLLAITSAAGLVLWCDEQRRWFLAYPENRTIVTLINVSPATTRDGQDTLSRDDVRTFATGVAVHYSWQDPGGAAREAWDTAGTEEKVLVVELRSPYPGPGAAAAILARRQGTGRRQNVTVHTVMGATPGMTAALSLPGAPDTIARVAAVEFDLHEGFMDLDLTGLVDIIPGSIAALTGTIDGLSGTIDSL